MNKKNWIYLGMIAVVMIIVGIIFAIENHQGVYESYKDFYNKVKNNQVEKAEIGDEKVIYYLNKDVTKYYTDNPNYDGFKEFLLLNNVKIEKTFGTSDLNYIFDILFYLIFIVAVCLGVYKLIRFTNSNFKIIRKSKTKFTDIARYG